MALLARGGGRRGNRQLAWQPSPETRFPSSQSSPGSRSPSPQSGNAMQSLGHGSPESLLPSSQFSPTSTTPSPHVATAQVCSPRSTRQTRPDGHTPPPGQSTV